MTGFNDYSRVPNPTTHDPRPNDEVFIEVKGLTHVYNSGKPGECPALSGIDLDIKKGEFIALIGPNGSGKSTFARHLNALLLPTEGKVAVDGFDTRRPEHVFEIRRRVGMVFQNPDNQIVSSIVEEDVAFGPENLGLPPEEVRNKVEDALNLTGLTAYRMHAPHLLSGGEKQRLAIAGVLSMNTTCLVLDEPSSMLDPAGRRELVKTLVRLNRCQGVTIILVTHLMEEAARSDRIAVMAGGKVVLEGHPAYVFANAEFLKELDLELPAVAEIARGLERRGLLAAGNILTGEDMLSYISQHVY